MKDVVVIKSFSNGIRLQLDPACDFDHIIDELAFKFSEAKVFFGKGTMALSIEGRELTDAEEIYILETIRRNSNLNIACIVGHDEEKDKHFLKALQRVKDMTEDDSGQFYKGSLKNHQVVETGGSVVILGDVYPGCTVISARNIIILGGLYGEAYAGGDGQEDAYIVALEMEPEN